jgi:phage shock protein E
MNTKILKIKDYLVLVCVMLLLVAGCAQQEDTMDQDSKTSAGIYQKITAQEAKAIIDGEEDVIILDVRTDSEYKAGHIEGSVLLPHTEIKEKAHQMLPDKNAIILVYCRTGIRSARGSNFLLEMGYTNVYDFGGIVDWPYEVVQ